MLFMCAVLAGGIGALRSQQARELRGRMHERKEETKSSSHGQSARGADRKRKVKASDVIEAEKCAEEAYVTSAACAGAAMVVMPASALLPVPRAGASALLARLVMRSWDFLEEALETQSVSI